jgi:hypothetical protein
MHANEAAQQTVSCSQADKAARHDTFATVIIHEGHLTIVHLVGVQSMQIERKVIEGQVFQSLWGNLNKGFDGTGRFGRLKSLYGGPTKLRVKYRFRWLGHDKY